MDTTEDKVNALIQSFTEWQITVSEQLAELQSKTTETSIRKAARKEYEEEAKYLDTLRRDVVKLLREIK
jgi:hypothetical protein